MRDIIILMSSTYLNQCPDTMCLNMKKIVSRHGIFQRHGSGKPGFYIYLRHENFRVFDTGHFPTDADIDTPASNKQNIISDDRGFYYD